MKRIDSTSLTPAIDNGELVIRIPERETRANGIHASNDASPVRLAVWSFGVLALAAAIIAYAIHWLTGWALPVTSLIGVAFFLLTASGALVVLNGDFPAVYNIRQSEKTERMRIKASENTFALYYDIKSAEEEHRHVEHMAQIVQDGAVTRLQNDMTSVRDTLNRILTHSQDPVITSTQNYVAAQPRPALIAAQQWIVDLYDIHTGRPHSDKVHDNGTLKIPAPWRKRSGEWMREPWGQQAADYVLTPIYQEQPIIVPIMADNKPRGYRLNVEVYPSLGRIHRVFSTIA